MSELRDDGELLAALRGRDVTALEALYDRYASYVMGISIKILGSREEAEEVVQDVFWRLWRTELLYDPLRGRFSTWLYAVARNGALDRVRRRGRTPPDADALRQELAEPENPGRNADRAQLADAVRGALDTLSGDQRQAIKLAFYEGYTHREIAERTGQPLGTVKSRIKRALSKLEATLANMSAA